MGNKASLIEDKRTVEIGVQNYKFSDNKITSSKYTIWNFLPRNLFKQFRRVANLYFLIMSILTCIIESPVNPWASFIPLMIVVSVSAVKQAYEDWLRHRADAATNSTTVTIIQDGVEKMKMSKDIRVGDMIKLPNEGDIPCDMVIMSTSRSDAKCYVTTSNLDGETNLKRLDCPLHTYMAGTENERIVGKIECQLPTADLYSFCGTIDIEIDRDDPLVKRFPECIDPEMELEETVNTDLVDFNKVVHFKNSLTISNLLLRGSRLKNTAFVIGCAVYTGHDTKLAYNSRKTSQKSARSERAINYYLAFFFILLVLEVIVSLVMDFYEDLGESRPYLGYYSGLTFQHFMNELFSYIVLYYYIIPISLYVTVEFQRFLGAFYFNWDDNMIYNEQSSSANTSDINEDLGQVEYLFTDKTGTLTQNEMTFRQFSVGGMCYEESNGKIHELHNKREVPLNEWPTDVEMLFLGMAICHTVQTCANVETNLSQLNYGYLPQYEATSADEKALVEGGARCGVIYLGEESGIISVKFKEKLIHFKKIKMAEFSSERKRMSVLVIPEDGKAIQFCKGAESAIIPLVAHGMLDNELQNAKLLSVKGLRTLLFAWRRLEGDALREIMSTPELLEEDLSLLGVTAVEDHLQLDVEITLNKLTKAGIKVWILTGDRMETAMTVAMACGHIKSDILQLKFVDHTDISTCLNNLNILRSQIKEEFCLIIDGRSFKIAFDDPECTSVLLEVALQSQAVLCCRLAPKQKSQIIHIIKETKLQPLTAAIGDGANDVAMILEAHVGIGLLGKEGRQAANNSDFIIPTFCALQRAFLVHGHWYYFRIATLVFFAIHNGVSPQPLFSSVFFLLYNTAFTALPVVIYSLLEQDYSPEALIRKPELYATIKHNALLSWKYFLGWLVAGIWHSVVVYFLPWLMLEINPMLLISSEPIDLTGFGTTVIHCTVIVVNLKLLIHSRYWTVYFVLSVAISIIGFIAFTLTYSVINISFNPLYGVYAKLIISPTFWLLSIMVTILSLIPDCLVPIIRNIVMSQAVNFSHRNFFRRKQQGCYIVQRPKIV